ncbi:MAG: fumarylacetoacetate hydrolase family protein [Myxococcales bacterium]|nr:MAG: fumarylacetoacetate hydrolase family protein [Myxococcales bacterium]
MPCFTLNGQTFTPSKIVCIGQNYAAHNREMGRHEAPGEPIIFIKPNGSLHTGGGRLAVPQVYGLLHHEVELGFVIGRQAKNIPEAQALELVAGYAVGIDLTLRERQKRDRAVGNPWDLAKGFDDAAPFAAFVPASAVADPHDLTLALSVNGVERQRGSTREMTYRIPALISYVSKFMTLEPGDLFMTGTPSGVGPLEDGDRVHAEAAGLPALELTIARP